MRNFVGTQFMISLLSLLALSNNTHVTVDENSAHKVVMHLDENDPKKMSLV